MKQMALNPKTEVSDTPINVYKLFEVIRDYYPGFYRQHPELTITEMAVQLLTKAKVIRDLTDFYQENPNG